eukprot:GHVU01155163.1.p1 GENE.GHVU01155163.1~~GHVU01155163.1.p1  ORF type:complete len:120 (-),score=4.74 GHVU01155163.1:17-376(-)
MLEPIYDKYVQRTQMKKRKLASIRPKLGVDFKKKDVTLDPTLLAHTLTDALIDHDSSYVMCIGQSRLDEKSKIYVRETGGTYRQLSMDATGVQRPMNVDKQSPLQVVIAKTEGRTKAQQ